MTSSARPNLGGLFNGSTPPQRPSRITETAAPRLLAAPARDVPIREVPTGEVPQEPTAVTTEQPTPEGGDLGGLAGWADPVALVNQYFRFLRTVLDVNQQWALACASAVAALPRKVGLHRAG